MAKLKFVVDDLLPQLSQVVGVVNSKNSLPILNDVLSDDCIILWIDALGAEWLPLLYRTLEKDNKGDGIIQDFVSKPC